MTIRPEEVTSIIKKELSEYEARLKIDSVGWVLQVGDGIARIYGLSDVMMQELLEFPNNIMGLALNLEENIVGAILLGGAEDVKDGDIVKRTGKIAQVPVGKALIGRVVDPIGRPLDGKGPIVSDKFRPIEYNAPNVVQRQPVKESLHTGIIAIDSMIPIGRGQRELILGDRQTGKTAIVVDTIISQKEHNVFCVYVAIGQKLSNVVSVAHTLQRYGAMEYTTIVSATSDTAASLQYLAPYAGCAIGEEYLYNGKHCLVIYDDLSKHSQSYRQLSLLLRRPPGREAFPGDIFYLHSRLLERACKLQDNLGGGSLTAIPIVETQAGDIATYIPTNVISITDGQIYLESDLFYAGVRPAINVGLSVSRVGGNAQEKAMRKVAARLRLDLAQYRELSAFTQFGQELDKHTRAQLAIGERLVEVLKQGQYEPLSLEKQAVILYAGVQGYLDDIPVGKIKEFQKKFYSYLEKEYPDVLHSISKDKDITPQTEEKLKTAIQGCKKQCNL